MKIALFTAIALTPFVAIVAVRSALGPEMASALVGLVIAFILGAAVMRAWLLERHRS